MKNITWLTICIAWFGLQPANAQPTNPVGNYHPWWRDRPFGRAYAGSQTNQLSLVRVQGNKFVGPDGQAILFRGLSISDPDKIVQQGHWNKAHFEKVKEMGATVVRIPVHPSAWRERTPQDYLKLLDQAVDWCTELNLHVIIDWHTIGNLQMELFQDPMYDTSRKETFEFWRTIARHFKGTRTIAFYELFNEPTLYRGQLGGASWSEWKKLNEDMIRLIRAFDTEKIPLVAGFDWAYDLTPLHQEPIEAEGIGYVTHPYANKRSKPWPPKWEEDFGFAAGRYPVFATEFGYSVREGTEGTDNDYGDAIINYLEEKGISWAAWCYDPEWGPTLLQSWNYDLTASGKFFIQAMQAKGGN
jgi:endoglucanase